MRTADDFVGSWWHGPVGTSIRAGDWAIQARAEDGGIAVVVGNVVLEFSDLAVAIEAAANWGFCDRAEDPQTAAVQHAMEVAWGALIACGGRINSKRLECA